MGGRAAGPGPGRGARPGLRERGRRWARSGAGAGAAPAGPPAPPAAVRLGLRSVQLAVGSPPAPAGSAAPALPGAGGWTRTDGPTDYRPHPPAGAPHRGLRAGRTALRGDAPPERGGGDGSAPSPVQPRSLPGSGQSRGGAGTAGTGGAAVPEGARKNWRRQKHPAGGG